MKGKRFYLNITHIDGKDQVVIRLSNKLLYACDQGDAIAFMDGMCTMAKLHGSEVAEEYDNVKVPRDWPPIGEIIENDDIWPSIEKQKAEYEAEQAAEAEGNKDE